MGEKCLVRRKVHTISYHQLRRWKGRLVLALETISIGITDTEFAAQVSGQSDLSGLRASEIGQLIQ